MAQENGNVELSHEEILRYSRHLLMPEVGLAGQKLLKAASVLLIGTGGLGSPAALYLAAAGVGRIGLVDYDVVDFSNLQRQVIHGTSNLGALKVESARQRMLDLNPDIQVQVYNEPFTSENAMRIAQDYDILVDGTDNFPTRYLVNDVCVLLGKPNVYGSIFRFDGQVSVFDARRGPCYRCLFPEPPPPGLVPSCAEGGVLGVLPGTIGTLQATETLKLILGVGEPLIGRLLLYNALDVSFEFVNLRKNPRCKICGPEPEVTELIDYEAFCGVPGHDHEEGAVGGGWDIEATELADRLARGESIHLVDVREPHELEIASLSGSQLIPLGQLAARLSELDTADEMVVFCKGGTRSARALELLVSAGFRKVKNLKGGINAWAREVDPSMPLY
jgi:adenylyltransferase/sulfurtransferase